jgi:alkanesulfonate monooxygenase SsuD/methylene tetrahydromethanopterin reductase-like flavin-dependent oxidoreductase (luciferase family)
VTQSTHRFVADHSLERTAGRIANNPHKLKLGVFGPNLAGGTAGITTADGPPVVGNWDEARGIAVAADRAGLDVLVPIARWKGFGGPSGFWDRSLETFTWAAAIAEATENISIFTSCLIPMTHPVLAAKMGATVDHVSKGRWGLNIVPGWVGEEFEMFGLPMADRDKRYAYAEEWITIVRRLWSEEGEFDFDGEFFQLKNLVSAPRPVQTPRPTVMNAGQSPTGQAFALRNADMVFMQLYFTDDELAANTRRLREAAAEQGKEVQVWGTAHIVCRSSEAEAEDYIAEYVDGQGDFEAAERYASTVMGTDSGSMGGMQADPALVRGLVQAGGNRPLVGTPEQVVAQLENLSDLGVDGIGLAWVDYDAGIEQYATELLPLLRKAGLRADG